MDAYSLTLAYIFGTIIGSFLNVVSLRFNTGTGIGGRSKCMSCGTTLTWKELVPLFSYTLQLGKCKKCKSKISWQYPLVEFIGGILFVLIFISFPPVDLLTGITTFIYIVASCLLLVVSAYDIKHKIIPDQFVYSFVLLSLINLCIGGSSYLHVPSISAFIAGPLLALPFALLWLISRGTWMGLGDAKLVLGIGWFTGIGMGINAVILSFWIAAFVSIIWLFVTYGRFKAKTEIPFGPYLILGMYLVLIFKIQIIDIHLVKDILMVYL